MRGRVRCGAVRCSGRRMWSITSEVSASARWLKPEVRWIDHFAHELTKIVSTIGDRSRRAEWPGDGGASIRGLRAFRRADQRGSICVREPERLRRILELIESFKERQYECEHVR